MTIQRLLALWFGSALWKRVLLGLFLGSLCGMVFQDESKVLQPIGDLFLRSIKMIVAPLVLSTIVTGIVSMGDLGKLSSMGAKIVVFYLCTTAIAILIGIGAASLLPSLPLADEALQTEKPIILVIGRFKQGH